MGEAVLSNLKLADTGVSCLTMLNYIDLVQISTNKLIIQAPWVGNLYRLYVEIVQPEHSLLAQGHPVSTVSLTLWHHRLGHISKDTIHRMEKLSLTEGMKLVGNEMEDYSACRKGRQT